MKKTTLLRIAWLTFATVGLTSVADAQIGRRFPSEKKVVIDPVTGVPLTFLTSTAVKNEDGSFSGDSKIYQTHHQWTSDGKWVIFRSARVRNEAMAVNEDTGDIVQVTEGGYTSMLCVADHSMHLYFLRNQPSATPAAAAPAGEGAPPAGGRGGRGPRGPVEVVQVDLAKLFADSAANKLKGASEYQHVLATIPAEKGANDMALDPTEEFAYVREGKEEAAKYVTADTKIEPPFGNRGMGGGPTGLMSVNLKTGELKHIVSVGFQIGHVQTNPWMPGEIVFCWETGGKAPQRTWTVMSDGTGLRPLYPEADYDWITHEAVITKDEVAIAMLYLRTPLGGRGGRNGGAGQAPAAAVAQGGQPAPDAQNAQAGQAAQGRQGANGARGGGRRGGNAAPATPPPPEQAEVLAKTGMDGHPTGIGIVNLRTREMRIVGQVPLGDPGRSVWHVNGSPDGRWAVADDFQYRLWIVDRHTGEMALLADLGHKTTAADHIHPTFNADSTKIEVQSAMLAEDGRALNICVVPVPKSWLDRKYTQKIE
jgi:oligogalacturonide lyase